MHAIDIANNQDLLALDEDFLREVARETLRAEGVAAAEISIALVDDETIHALNKRHLGHDDPTDVLSFLFDCMAAARQHPSPSGRGTASKPKAQKQGEGSSAPTDLDPPPRGRGKTIDGEVVVSVETALSRAAECGWSPRDEIALYLVHGLLHLVGYDDHSEDDRRLMRSRERAILAAWNLTPHVDP